MLFVLGEDNELSSAPCPLGVTICLADVPPKPLGLPQSPSRDWESAPWLKSHSFSPGLLTVAGRDVPEGRGLQARDVPGRGRGHRAGHPGQARVMRLSPLLREVEPPLPSPICLHPEAPREPESQAVAGSLAFRANRVREGAREAHGAGP